MAGRLLLKSGLAVSALTASAGAVCYHTDVLNNPWSSSFRIVRFGRAAFAAFCVSFDYKWSLRDLEYGTYEYRKTIQDVHLRSALRLREMCSRNGGLFIKVGQHVGSLEYILPRVYVKTFKVFHSEAPKTSLDRLKSVIEEEFGQPADSIYSDLSPEPLGAASLAQCHKGVLKKTGETVAIKIQHPDVHRNGYTDMDTIEFLVGCVHWLFPDFTFKWLVEEIRSNLPMELNFCQEARNQDRFSAMFSKVGFVKAPIVHWDFTTPRVLTMEYCEGGKVDDVDYMRRNGLSGDEISLKLGRMYSEMIFMRGFIHCDPHAGNVLVRPGPDGLAQIVLLDHGLYKELTDDFRLTYCRLWQALISRDKESIKRHCLDLNAGELYPLLACMITARTWDNVESGITQKQRSRAEMRAIQQHIPLYLSHITQLLNNIPRQLVLILKTNDLLRSLEYSLNSPLYKQSYITMSKYCVRAIGEHEAGKTDSSWIRKVRWRARTELSLLMVSLYEAWLWVKAMFVSV